MLFSLVYVIYDLTLIIRTYGCLKLWAGVEVFVFHWGCTRLGALVDDQRGPTGSAHGGTEPLLRLLDNFFQVNPEQTCS